MRSTLTLTGSRRRQGTNAPALPLGWRRTPQPDAHGPRYVQAVAISHDGERLYAATYFAEYGRGNRGRPEAQDYAVYAYDADGGLRWRAVCSSFEGVYALDTSDTGDVVAACGWAQTEPHTNPCLSSPAFTFSGWMWEGSSTGISMESNPH